MKVFKFDATVGTLAGGAFLEDIQEAFNAHCINTNRDGEIVRTINPDDIGVSKSSLITNADFDLQNDGHGGSEWLLLIKREADLADQRMAVVVMAEDVFEIFCLDNKAKKVSKFVLLESEKQVLAIVPESGSLYIQTTNNQRFLISEGVCVEVKEFPETVYANICTQN